MKKETNDPIIPAYNTPEHKFNLGCLIKNIHLDQQKAFLRNYSLVLIINGYKVFFMKVFLSLLDSYQLMILLIYRLVKKLLI